MMRYLFSPAGREAIAQVIVQQPLLAFDFDGTLAPIVTQPDQAKAGLSMTRAMQSLCAIAPVAIVTGRSIEDVRDRLGFAPKYIVGNHGAQSEDSATKTTPSALPERWRESLAQLEEAFSARGIVVEDKGQSMTLHYRLASDRDSAKADIMAWAKQLRPAPRLIGGKCVVNLLPDDAPDKFEAIERLLKLEGRTHAVFIGDDVTDDVVFENAPPHWLTVRVEHLDHKQARFFLNSQSEVTSFVRELVEAWQALPGNHSGVPR
jgi:trehalose 6-phosphate phosphatase